MAADVRRKDAEAAAAAASALSTHLEAAAAAAAASVEGAGGADEGGDGGDGGGSSRARENQDSTATFVDLSGQWCGNEVRERERDRGVVRAALSATYQLCLGDCWRWFAMACGGGWWQRAQRGRRPARECLTSAQTVCPQ